MVICHHGNHEYRYSHDHVQQKFDKRSFTDSITCEILSCPIWQLLQNMNVFFNKIFTLCSYTTISIFTQHLKLLTLHFIWTEWWLIQYLAGLQVVSHIVRLYCRVRLQSQWKYLPTSHSKWPLTLRGSKHNLSSQTYHYSLHQILW